MIRFLIRLLGGYTKDEYGRASKEANSELLTDKAVLETKIENFEIQLKDKVGQIEKSEKEAIRLQNLISKVTEESKEHRERINSELKEKIQKMTEEKEKAIKEIELDTQRKLKDAGFIGNMAEEDVLNILKHAFPNDLIELTGTKGIGDIVHTIKNNHKIIGVFHYEVKNRSKWEWPEYDKFILNISKLNENKKKDLLLNFFVSKNNVFPSMSEGKTQSKYKHIEAYRKNNLYYDNINKIFITDFNNFLSLIIGFRDKHIENDKLKIKTNNMESYKDQVFDFFESENFTRAILKINQTFTTTYDKLEKSINTLKDAKDNLYSSREDSSLLISMQENVKSNATIESNIIIKNK